LLKSTSRSSFLSSSACLELDASSLGLEGWAGSFIFGLGNIFSGLGLGCTICTGSTGSAISGGSSSGSGSSIIIGKSSPSSPT